MELGQGICRLPEQGADAAVIGTGRRQGCVHATCLLLRVPGRGSGTLERFQDSSGSGVRERHGSTSTSTSSVVVWITLSAQDGRKWRIARTDRFVVESCLILHFLWLAACVSIALSSRLRSTTFQKSQRVEEGRCRLNALDRPSIESSASRNWLFETSVVAQTHDQLSRSVHLMLPTSLFRALMDPRPSVHIVIGSSVLAPKPSHHANERLQNRHEVRIARIRVSAGTRNAAIVLTIIRSRLIAKITSIE